MYLTPKIVLLTALFFSESTTAQNITTIAGNGTGGYSGDGSSAPMAQLQGPQGLALDAAGNIYVADLLNNRVRKVNASTGIITTIAGTGATTYNGDLIPATSANLYAPSALAFDANGNLYLTDRYNNRIRKIDTTNGIITTVAGTGVAGYNGDGISATTAELNAPNEVAFDSAGNLFIADWFNNRIRKVDKTTGMISTIAGTGIAGYNGENIAATSANINGPCGIIFDQAGNIYFAEYNGNRIRKITISSGIVNTIAGTGTAGFNGDGILATSAQLFGPAYIKFDALENMYIGDAINYRVRKISASSGVISTIAGTGTAGYNGDNIPATTAELNLPFYVYFDRPVCNMYIADYANNRVRKISGGFVGCVLLSQDIVLFTGRRDGIYNLLQWQAGKPTDGYFDVQRSDRPSDFRSIGIVHESVGQLPAYSFVDHSPPNGVNYYRLKHVESTGTVSYSRIVFVREQSSTDRTIIIYPNPSDGGIHITSSGPLHEVQVLDIAGRLIFYRAAATNHIFIRIGHSGIYVIKLFSENKFTMQEVIVRK